ncbi:Hypothetical protein LUCI_2700 [Lucifera butyrica]|uniref:Uncharacterized protein n=1 Tax=Lucifera butyrica TaxID=1351585 RepID=A0A498R7U0_9FIRM|nr:Hypothetical protein LUCI_2700 [Lucifera butyrica]
MMEVMLTNKLKMVDILFLCLLLTCYFVLVNHPGFSTGKGGESG